MKNNYNEISGGGIYGGRLLLFQSLPSTNAWVLANTALLSHGDVVIAAEQSSGHGRFDRKWISPPGTCLTTTLVLKFPPRQLWIETFTGQVAALAVRRLLESLGIRAMVKWPNDVTVGGSKISGILCERDADSGTIAAGIGLNVNLTANEIALMKLDRPVTSILNESGIARQISDIAAQLGAEMEDGLSRALESGVESIISEWQQSDFLAGRTITVHGPEGDIQGAYAGIATDGRLLLRNQTGDLRSFWSGDVTLFC